MCGAFNAHQLCMIRIENMLNQAHMWCFVNAQQLCMIRIENMSNQAHMWCFVSAQQLCMIRIENMLNQARMWCFVNAQQLCMIRIDTIPRDRLWAAVSDAVKLKGLSVVLEAGHAGTRYIIRNSLGRLVTKVHVTMEVRQGRVESPLCFILLHALSITQAQKKDLSIRESLRWFTWEHSEQIGLV